MNSPRHINMILKLNTKDILNSIVRNNINYSLQLMICLVPEKAGKR